MCGHLQPHAARESGMLQQQSQVSEAGGGEPRRAGNRGSRKGRKPQAAKWKSLDLIVSVMRIQKFPSEGVPQYFPHFEEVAVASVWEEAVARQGGSG